MPPWNKSPSQSCSYRALWDTVGFSFLHFFLFRLDLELKDHEGSTALWLAVQYITVSSDLSVNPFEDAPVENGTSFDENSFAARLIQRGSNTDAPDTVTGGREWRLGWGGRGGPRTFAHSSQGIGCSLPLWLAKRRHT